MNCKEHFEPQHSNENIIVKTISGIGYDGYSRDGCSPETNIHLLSAIASTNIAFWNHYFDKVISVFIQVNLLIYVRCYTA